MSKNITKLLLLTLIAIPQLTYSMSDESSLMGDLENLSLSDEQKSVVADSDTLPEIVTISQSDLARSNESLNVKLAQAARQGFFYLEMPEEANELITHSIDFANAFGKDETLKNLKFDGFSGYHDREHAQVESFYLEQSLWETVFPQEVTNLAEILNRLSLDIFSRLLPIVLPTLDPKLWEIATGEVSENNGLVHFSFNHYRPDKQVMGLQPHRDFGYLSLLFIDKKGLFAKVDEKWMPIMPKPGHLIVNFGKAFEILVNDPKKLVACWHYVEQISEETHNGDRMSFVHSTDNQLIFPVQKVTPSGELEIVYPNYKAFMTASFSDLYDGQIK